MLTTPAARIAALALTASLSATACGGGSDPTTPATAGVPAATDRCDAPAFPPVQFGAHLLGDAAPPVPYSSTPPTSGWHLSGAPFVGVAAEPMSEPAQVTTLEVGGVVLTHDPALGAEERAALAEAAARHPRTIAVTPYDQLDPGQVALASWGALQLCDGVDVQAIEAFVDAYGGDVTTGVDPVDDPSAA